MDIPEKPAQLPAACPKEVLDLIDRFERNREAYKSGQYKRPRTIFRK